MLEGINLQRPIERPAVENSSLDCEHRSIFYTIRSGRHKKKRTRAGRPVEYLLGPCFQPEVKTAASRTVFFPVEKRSPRPGCRGIVAGMIRIFFREILIALGCLSIVPLAIFIVVLGAEPSDPRLDVLLHRLVYGEITSQGPPLKLWFRLLTPYLLVQSIRAYWWSKQGYTPRRLANLYFAVILGVLGGWSFYHVWDLFYFMYALGDIPEAIPQLIKLESWNIAVFLITTFLAITCIRIFLDPTKRTGLGGKTPVRG